jgi:hypothetical protein
MPWSENNTRIWQTYYVDNLHTALRAIDISTDRIGFMGDKDSGLA